MVSGEFVSLWNWFHDYPVLVHSPAKMEYSFVWKYDIYALMMSAFWMFRQMFFSIFVAHDKIHNDKRKGQTKYIW